MTNTSSDLFIKSAQARSSILSDMWAEVVQSRNSILCAGLDPAEFSMGRKEEGLPEEVDKLDWSLKYVEAVAPFCAAVKPNFQYWKGEGDSEGLREVISLAKDLGLVVIDDSKLADIGPTNDAGMFYSKDMGADAVTIAPYAGNMKEAAEMARKREIGVITMCLMSNPEFERVKNNLVALSLEEREAYEMEDRVSFDGLTGSYVLNYIYLAHSADKFGLDGIVIGAPSDKNHISREEVLKVEKYTNDDEVVLLPGLGKQRGEAKLILDVFGPRRVIANFGRGMMFPNGSNSTPKEQASVASHYQGYLNEIRYAA